MKLAWILARKDLRETARDRLAFIFLLVMPLLFTMFFGLLFGGGSDRLPMVLHDADGGAAAKQLVAALEQSPVLKVTAATAADAEKAVDDEKAAAALLIPEGYSAAVAEGQKAALTIVATEGSSGAATVASEIRSVAGRQVAVGLASRAAAESVMSGRGIRPWPTRCSPTPPRPRGS
jgi:ABC-2 type transport system permease protein